MIHARIKAPSRSLISYRFPPSYSLFRGISSLTSLTFCRTLWSYMNASFMVPITRLQAHSAYEAYEIRLQVFVEPRRVFNSPSHSSVLLPCQLLPYLWPYRPLYLSLSVIGTLAHSWLLQSVLNRGRRQSKVAYTFARLSLNRGLTLAYLVR